MIARIFAVLSLLAIAGVGWWRLRRGLSNIIDSKSFLIDFHKALADYVQSGGKNQEAYTNLVSWSPRMQAALGSYGVGSYQAPYAGVIVHNYQIILNMIPDLRRWLDDDFKFISTRPANDVANTIRDTLLQHDGILSEALEDVQKELANPTIWFREGARWLVLFPLNLLSWFGIIGGSTASRVGGSWIVKLAISVSSVAIFLAALSTIIAGWDGFVGFIKGLFG